MTLHSFPIEAGQWGEVIALEIRFAPHTGNVKPYETVCRLANGSYGPTCSSFKTEAAALVKAKKSAKAMNEHRRR